MCSCENSLGSGSFSRFLPPYTLTLIPQVQSWFLLREDRGSIHQARAFLKQVMCYLPPWVAMAVTGSSMCAGVG